MDPLQASVTKLYEVFARYPLRAPIESCPCCRGPKSTRILETKPLRELNEEDLSQFAGSAMTTIGDVDDFRHFLPRVLELLARDQYFSPEIALGKLSLGEWLQWSVEEQAAVRGYLKEAWEWARREPWVEADAWLCGIASIEPDIEPYLVAWQLDSTPQAQAKLAAFIADAEGPAQQNESIQEWTARLKKEQC